MRSNCLIWSAWRFSQLLAQWLRDGRPAHRPRWSVMPSRSRPWWSMHWQVIHHDGTSWVREEFVPDERADVPWWLVWTRIVFRGHVERARE